MSLSHKGKKHTEEQKKKLSESNKNKHNIIHSTESKQKMREAKQRAVICINTSEKFNSTYEAANWCGLKSRSGITRVCSGERLTSGKHPITKEPLKWRWAD